MKTVAVRMKIRKDFKVVGKSFIGGVCERITPEEARMINSIAILSTLLFNLFKGGD